MVQWSRARFQHIFKIMGLLFGKKIEKENLKVQKENFARMKAFLEGDSSA